MYHHSEHVDTIPKIGYNRQQAGKRGITVKGRIVTLSENTAGTVRYLAEWGLCILVETDESRVLLDTGASISVQHNTDLMGIDLKEIDVIVLSHGHQDHTGGLREILRRRRKETRIIAHPDIWQAKYSRRPGKPDRYSGIPFQRAELESLGGRFQLTNQPVRITEHILTTGEVPMTTDFEEIASSLFTRETSGWQPDKLADDQALILTTPPGLFIVLGCAHRGIINTIYQAQKLTGIQEVYAVVGGCHLVRTSEERIRRTIAALSAFNIQKIGVSHCTGLPAATAMAQAFGERFFFNNTGSITNLP